MTWIHKPRICGVSRAATLYVTCALALAPAHAQLDERWTIKVGGQTITPNADGSFKVPNVPAPDILPASGVPDFFSDDTIRLTGSAVIEGAACDVLSLPGVETPGYSRPSLRGAKGGER